MTPPPFPSKVKLQHDLPSNLAGKIGHDVTPDPTPRTSPTRLADDTFSPRGWRTASQKCLCLKVWLSRWPRLPLGPRASPPAQKAGRSQ